LRQEQHGRGKKVLWIILILILPVVGLILYYLIGRGKLA